MHSSDGFPIQFKWSTRWMYYYSIRTKRKKVSFAIKPVAKNKLSFTKNEINQAKVAHWLHTIIGRLNMMDDHNMIENLKTDLLR